MKKVIIPPKIAALTAQELTLSVFYKIYPGDGKLMFDRFTNEHNCNVEKFYSHQCDIDRWKLENYFPD